MFLDHHVESTKDHLHRREEDGLQIYCTCVRARGAGEVLRRRFECDKDESHVSVSKNLKHYVTDL